MKNAMLLAAMTVSLGCAHAPAVPAKTAPKIDCSAYDAVDHTGLSLRKPGDGWKPSPMDDETRGHADLIYIHDEPLKFPIAVLHYPSANMTIAEAADATTGRLLQQFGLLTTARIDRAERVEIGLASSDGGLSGKLIVLRLARKPAFSLVLFGIWSTEAHPQLVKALEALADSATADCR